MNEEIKKIKNKEETEQEEKEKLLSDEELDGVAGGRTVF